MCKIHPKPSFSERSVNTLPSFHRRKSKILSEKLKNSHRETQSERKLTGALKAPGNCLFSVETRSLFQSWLRSHPWKFSPSLGPRKKRIEGEKNQKIQKAFSATLNYWSHPISMFCFPLKFTWVVQTIRGSRNVTKIEGNSKVQSEKKIVKIFLH